MKRVSNTSVTQQVQIIDDKVYDALSTILTKKSWMNMQIFVKHFYEKVHFILENYAPSLHGSLVISWEAFPAAFRSPLLEQGCDSHNFFA